jgi:ATP-binding cassette subfamily F protein 3
MSGRAFARPFIVKRTVDMLSVSHISKAFAEKEVLKDVSFRVEDKEKVGLIGINGAGKTTLLKIIAGEMIPDEGSVSLAKNAALGYLTQHQDLTDEHTIYESVLSARADILMLEKRLRDLELKMSDGEAESVMEEYVKVGHEFELKNGYAYRSEVTGVIKGLGFAEEDFEKRISTLSGGQKTRVALGRLLLSKPDLLMLDEPTNHLDMPSIAWLEGYLSSYPGAVLIVCHDRYFLDHVVTKIVEIDLGKSISFEGNYSVYGQKKQEMLARQLKAYAKQQAEIKHEQEVIEKLKSFNREKSVKRAESREKKLGRIELIERPMTADSASGMSIEFDVAVESGKDVLEVSDLSKSFDGKKIFENVNFCIRKGEHIALIGANGTGKTTILKIINEILPPDTGYVKLGAKVEIAYYDQEQQVLNMQNTLFEEMSDDHPDMNNTEIRNVLAAFLFTGEDVFKKIGDLSGGERGRVSLAKLMLSCANLLILDEPTNHLDIISKEILENAINSYKGTVLYVSHDRYFINKTAGRVLELTENGINEYLGNYDYYLEKKTDMQAVALTEKEPETAAKLDWKARKEEEAEKRKKASELKKVEDAIEKSEAEMEEIDAMLSDPENGNNVALLMELTKKRTELEKKIEALYEKWEEIGN